MLSSQPKRMGQAGSSPTCTSWPVLLGWTAHLWHLPHPLAATLALSPSAGLRLTFCLAHSPDGGICVLALYMTAQSGYDLTGLTLHWGHWPVTTLSPFESLERENGGCYGESSEQHR